MNVIRRFSIAAPLERVRDVLCSEEFQLEIERQRAEVVSTDFRRIEEGTERNVFELESVEYRRTRLGAIDRSGTCTSTTRNTWDGVRRTLSWVYSGGAAPARMAVSGVYRLRAEGERTAVEHEVTIEVKVPIIGGQIAKLAAREFVETAPRYEDALARNAAGPGARALR
jgi:hypothetical protein